MKTLFITTGRMDYGSSRIRAFWPAEYMEDAKVAPIDDIRKHNGIIPEAEKYIWQKTGDAKSILKLRENGSKSFLDLCDPVWWFQPKETEELIEAVDGIIFGTEALKEDFIRYHGAGFKMAVIPDGLKPEAYPLKREHRQVDPVRLIWFGICANRCALFSVTPYLERLRVNGINAELTIFDERPDVRFAEEVIPTYYALWSLEKENEIIANHDIALLPPFPGPWGKLKSYNKFMTASACGLPVTDGQDYGKLSLLCRDHIERQVNVFEPPEAWHVKRSAEMLEEFICE